MTPPSLGFHGKWAARAPANVLMDSRCYDGGTGRILTQDSIQPPVLGPMDTNLYVYGRACRLGYADPGWLAVPFKSACPEAPPSYSSTRLRSGRV